MHKRVSVTVGCLLLLTAGCGTTVKDTHNSAAQGTAGSDGGSPVVPGGGGVPDLSSVRPLNGHARGTAAATASGAPGEASRAGRSGSVVVHGVSSGTVLVGMTSQANVAAEDAALGGANQAPGDEKADAQAVAADINAHGGIAGHKVEIAFYQLDASSSESTDQQYQDACSYWTQDKHVFAILAESNPTLEACAAKAGVPMLSGGFSSSDAQTYRRYPSFIEISSFDLDRAGTATVGGLDAQHYFTGWNLRSRSVTSSRPKVGIIAWDTPSYRGAVQDFYLRALARLGLPKPETAYVAPPSTVSDVASASAAAKSVVLKWANDGVDHVIIVDGKAGVFGGGGLTLEFVNNAAAQNYYPRYGLNSASGLSQIASDLAPGSLNGSLGVGWLPLFDETQAFDPDSKASAARQHCVAVMAKAGIRAQNRNAEAIETEACDELYFVKAAVEAAGGRFTASRFLSGANALGGSFRSSMTDVTYFDATHHSGAAAVRPAVYRSDCTCYVYDGPPQRVS